MSTAVYRMRVHQKLYGSGFGKELQWNLSIADTLGTAKHVLISEVSTFQVKFYINLYLAGTHNSVLIKEVSLFQGCPYRWVSL